MATYNTTVANLRSLMDSAPVNTADTPHIINLSDGITTETNYNNLVNGISGNNNKYIELNIPSFTYTFNRETIFREQAKLVRIKILNFTGATSIQGIFENCNNLKSVNLSGLNNVTNMNFPISTSVTSAIESVTLSGSGTCTADNFLYGGDNYRYPNLTTVSLTGFTITSPQRMFARCTNLTNVNFTNVTISGDVSYMFDGCTSLTEIDTSSFTNVTNASFMFRGCTSLTDIDATSFTRLINGYRMFAGCTSLLEIDTSAFTNVTYAVGMFVSCTGLIEIDTSPFTKVTSAGDYSYIYNSGMFEGCSGLTEIDTTSFINVIDASRMFKGCTGLTEMDLSSMTSIIYAKELFGDCSDLENVILPDLALATEASEMFKNCTSLEEIHGWSIPLTATMTDCFSGCSSLQAIYVPEVLPQESTWHAWEMSKDTANTQTVAKVYNLDGTSVSVNVPSTGTYSTKVTDKVDELLFASAAGTITSAMIQKMLQIKAPITGSESVLDPTKDNFVLWAKNQQEIKTNIVTNTVEANNPLPPSSAAVHAAIAQMGLLMYPVGSIYMSVSPTNPTNFFGGTWQRLPDGVFIRNAGGDAGAVNTIQSEGLPNIKANIYGAWGSKNDFLADEGFSISAPIWTSTGRTGSGWELSQRNITLNARNSNTIYGSSSHVTPYNLAVYMWRRIS